MFPFDDVIMKMLGPIDMVDELIQKKNIYRKISGIRRTKSQNLNVLRFALQLSLPNLIKPGVKSIMKM